MDEIGDAIIDTLRCVGAEKGLVYVTVPITTGIREYQMMRILTRSREDLRRDFHDRWETEVKAANEADAKAFTTMVQLLNEDRLVLNPAELQITKWTQLQYTELWNEVLTKFCDKVVLTPNWAFSNGARQEVQRMLLLGRPVVDVFGTQVTGTQIAAADNEARATLVDFGWSSSEAETLLPRIAVPQDTPLMRRARSSGQDDTIKWLIQARRFQNRIPDLGDRERTLHDGPKAENGSWKTKMDKYLDRAHSSGIASPEGGTHLLSYVSIAIAYMEQVAEIFGPFPEPGYSSGDPVNMAREVLASSDSNQRLAVAIAWLLREMHYVRTKYSENDDDDNTRLGLSKESWWTRQLYFYWMQAHKEGLDTPRGRRMLGKFTSTAMGLASSRVRLFGLPPQPQFPPPETLRQRGIFD